MTQLFTGDHLESVLTKVANDMSSYLAAEKPENIVFIGIITNGVFFAKRIQNKLAQKGINIDNPVMEIDISLYRDDLVGRKDYVSINSSSIDVNLDDKHIVLFDDVLSTARTARAALNAIFDYGRPKKVSFAVLFDRQNRQVPIEPNIVGQELDVTHDMRVNVQFFEVVGEDQVVLADMVLQ